MIVYTLDEVRERFYRPGQREDDWRTGLSALRVKQPKRVPCSVGKCTWVSSRKDYYRYPRTLTK